jgi:hypothetical protein
MKSNIIRIVSHPARLVLIGFTLVGTQAFGQIYHV